MNDFLKSIIIISGGQTGVDIAALYAAKQFGFDTCGFAPKNFLTQVGRKPELKTDFNLEESAGSYNKRTRENIEISNGTIIFARNFESSGTQLTINYCNSLKKPYVLIPEDSPDPKDIKKSINFIDSLFTLINDSGNPIKINCAGNSHKSAPEIYFSAYKFFIDLFYSYLEHKIPDINKPEQNILLDKINDVNKIMNDFEDSKKFKILYERKIYE